MNLRDHDAPCEHHVLMSHEVWPDDGSLQGTPLVTLRKQGRIWECPGGAAVDIDYSAAAVALGIQVARDSGYDVVGVVDAALGLTDE